MTRRRGPVDGNGQPLDTHLFKAGGYPRRQEGAVHRHDHAQALAGAVGRQIENVLPQQGFAAGEDHHRLAHGGQVVQQGYALVGGQLPGIGPGARRGPAMETGQVAAPGGLPGQEAEGRHF